MKSIAPDNPISNQIRLIDMNIFPSFACNLNCSYCLHKNKENKFHKYSIMDKKLSVENFYNLTLFLERFRHPDRSLNIQINGGEPTLDWEYFQDYTLILRPLKDVYMTVITNLTGDYDREKINFLIRNYNKIVVSIDGNEKIHDFGRGSGSFNRTMENLMTLAAHARGNPDKIEINRTINEDNVDSFMEGKDFFDSLRISNTYNIDFLTPKRDKKYFVQTLLKQYSKYALKYENLNCIPFLTYGGDDQYCLDKHVSMTVFPTGEISHCVAKYDKEKIFYDLSKFPAMEFDIEKFNKIKTNGFYDKTCETCKANTFCQTGCYAAFEEDRQVFCNIMHGIGILRDELKDLLKRENKKCDIL